MFILKALIIKIIKKIYQNIYKEIKAVKKYNGKIIYSNDETYSSSNLINNSGILFNDEQKKYLNSIKKILF